ncbi:sugar kinase [Streptomyces sp. B6B3]|uniref:sugar kinase n=1 Tax=Streptomyces sp. B6B3 TaxID=3153570 RepID=UPI00325F3CD7
MTGAGAPEVVVCGETMELLLAEPGVPLAQATTFRRSIAGAESNVAAGLARLGHAVRWLGRVGDDPSGRFVLSRLRADALDVSHAVVDPAAPTGLLLRDCHAARPVDVQYHRAGSAASRLRPEEFGAEQLAGARLLHLTGITPMLSDTARAATDRLLTLAAEQGVTISLDPNVRLKLGDRERWREVVGPLLERADIVLAGADELDLLAPATPAAAQTVVVKHPDKSASCHTTGATAGATATQPAFAVPVADPVGAGDAFAAGFLSGWLRGIAPARALAEAAAVAALVVQCPTDTDGLPDRAGLERALATLADGAEAVHR